MNATQKMTPEQKRLFNELNRSRSEDFKTFNKKSYRGVWSSIIDKYPESAHFVYELLQNADDAEATEVQIVLKQDCLMFKHNGKKHFDITPEDSEYVGDINSITGIGDSSKIDTQNKIGKFGVGFKAVFQYTDTPEIYDEYFKFKIENYIIPSLLDHDHPERQSGETLFVFPFKDCNKSYTDILNRLQRLQNPILFLRNLERIVWRIDTNDSNGTETEYSKEILDTVDYDRTGISLNHYRLNEPNKQTEIFLFSQDVLITDKDGAKSNHLINVGFYYDPKSKKLITDNLQNIFCFFPTKETFKTCFISHAPFLLTDNRQNLKPGENINKCLVELLSKLAAKGVVLLRDYKPEKGVTLIDENITEIIPNYTVDYWQELDPLFEKPIESAFTSILQEERLLISRNGKYLSLTEAYIGTPRELVDLIDQKQFIKLKECDFDEDYDDEMFKSKNIDFLKWELSQNITSQDNDLYEDISRYGSEDFASDITESFMSAQDMKWVTRFYTFLRTAAPKLWKLTEKDRNKLAANLPFRKAPIIKTQKGNWVKPFVDGTIANVYLPLDDENESEYNFVAKEYLGNEMAKKFFSELDIKKPDEYDYIRQVIFKKFIGQQIKVNVSDLKADFVVLLGYYLKVRDKVEIGQTYLEQLRKTIYLSSTTNHIYRPNKLYFYNEQLSDFLGDSEKRLFVNIALYEDAIKKYSKEVVIDFMAKLGVRRFPLIEQTKRWGTYALSPRMRKQVIVPECFEYHIIDYVFPEFEEFCSRKKYNFETSLYIWNVLLPAIVFSKFENLQIVYRRKYARSNEYAYFISTFRDVLINNKWLKALDGNVYSAKDIALEDLSPEYERNNGLIQFLGIEKREKSIIELGGTEEQQDNMDFGKMVKNAAGDELTQEEILNAIAEAKARKKGTYKENVDNARNPENEVKEEEAPSAKERSHVERTVNPSKQHNNDIKSDTNENLIEDSEVKVEVGDAFVNRDELRKTELKDLFINTGSRPLQQKEKEQSNEEIAEVAMQKLVEQEEKNNKIKELREIASNAIPYTKEWFNALIELEYRGNAETDKDNSNKSINITFGSVEKERGSERIYKFYNPSRNIPLWMEEIGDIEVKCWFSNNDDLLLKFEVANVRDNSLRLKASKAYEAVLNKIDWKKCTKASITLKNQIDLMGKVRTAFNALGFEDGFNLKDNLENNLRFIFGPPGTGKTTTLAKEIIGLMQSDVSYHILVLAPTNTACDEIARKIQVISKDECNWLHRFISTADEGLEDIVIDRESEAYENNKCCIISTIARLSFDGFNTINGFIKLTDLVWDTVICDEASMIPLAEMMLAVYSYKNTPILIAGDPMQIKPILHEEKWKDENIYTMVHLDRFDNPVTEPIQFEIENLGIQYRSVPAIGELFSRYAYDGKLKHNRTSNETGHSYGKLALKPINFIPFKVERYDSIFGIKKLDGSNVHIYSVLFTVELFKYIYKEIAKANPKEFSIGVVCPYSPQAQLIDSMIKQIPNIPENIKITVGTVHRFQGGQCNLVFVVLNPPLGMKTASDRIFLNKKNILNVAISRAQDNLCILMPHRDTEGYENLYEINTIGSIALSSSPECVGSFTCDEVEDIVFGKKFFIESNTFVTSHQLANVYTKAVKRYEVRIDEKSVDIQIGTKDAGTEEKVNTKYNNLEDSSIDQDNSIKKPFISEQDSTKHPETKDENVKPEHSNKTGADFTCYNSIEAIKKEIDASMRFTSENQYYEMFKRVGFDLEEAIETLIVANSYCSMYVLVQILGSESIRNKFNWRKPSGEDIKKHRKSTASYDLFRHLYVSLFPLIQSKRLMIKDLPQKNMEDVSLEVFIVALKKHIDKITTKRNLGQTKTKHKTKSTKNLERTAPTYYSNNRPSAPKTGHMYDDFEYGLSDW